MEHFQLDIRKSPIHGKGIFTCTRIPTDMLVYESNDYETRPNAVYGSVQRSSAEHILEANLRWQNHSCSPNTVIYFDGPVVKLVSTRDILDGDELVCDYFATEDLVPIPFQCNCGHCEGKEIR